jgi:ABC-type glutathione transport system ATPase component
MKDILEVQQLIVQAGDQIILDRVSFKAKEGKITALVGGSGSGKTTIAYSLLDLLPAGLEKIQGQIIFNHKDIHKMDPRQKRALRGKDITMVFQEPLWAFDPLMTIGEQMDEVLAVHSELNKAKRKERVLMALDKAQLPYPKEMYARYPHQLSGGQRQRAMIAQAIVASPKLIIADEPTSNLDVTLQAMIMDLFRQFRSEGMSLLLITHDLGMVMHLADEVVILQQGRVVESGAVSQIMKHPQHKYTRTLLEAFI